jgi:4-amino-4-deoxy-L-arabinose transferase-like glycosyltransferase
MSDRTERRALVIVLLGAAMMLFLNLGGRAFGVGDVLRYAVMVLEMRHAGSIIPTMDGQPYHAAAPLAAWLPWFSTWCFGGLSTASILLPSAIAAFITLVLTHRLTRVFDYRTATVAAAFGAICYLTWIYGRQSRIDWLTAFAHIAALAASYMACTTPGWRRLLWWLAGGLALGLGVASKGLFSVGILGTALGPFVLLTRRWRAMIEGGLILLATAALVTAAWMLPYAKVLGPDGTDLFVRIFLGEETMDKFGGDFGKQRDLLWYFWRGVPLLAPLTILAGVGVFRALRHPNLVHPLMLLSACGTIFPVLLLSLSGGKHMRYLVPLVPSMAILSGWVLTPWLREPRLEPLWKWVARSFGLLGVISGIVVIATAVIWLGSLVYAVVIGVAAIGAGVYAFRRAADAPAACLALYFGAAAIITWNFAVFMPSPYAEGEETYLHLARAIAPHLDDDEVLVVTDVPPATYPLEPVRLSPSTLALYLPPRWIDLVPPDEIPDDAVVLALKPKPGRKVRREIDWVRRGGWTDEWLLLGPKRE